MHPTLQPYVLPAAAPPPIGRNAPALAPAPGKGWGEAWGGVRLGVGWGEARARAVRCEHLPPLGAYIRSMCVPCLPCDVPYSTNTQRVSYLAAHVAALLGAGSLVLEVDARGPRLCAGTVAASGTQGRSPRHTGLPPPAHKVAACEHLG